MEKALRRISLRAEGISCAGCATDMETVLRNSDGIMNAKVNYTTGIINIEYNPDETAPDRIISLIKKLGFNTSPFKN